MDESVVPKQLTFASNNHDFIAADAWRILRIMAEFVDSFEVMAKQPETLVAVFGSARIREDEVPFQEAKTTGELLVRNGYGVITGGGSGIMGAANWGAHEAGGCSIGLNIELPHEQKPNPHQTTELAFHYFFTRKVCFLKYALAVIVFPGGFGTFDEFFEVLTMMQTGKINRIPLVLVGKKFWSGLIEWLKQHPLKERLISPEDLDLFKLVDSGEEAVEYISQCHRFGVRGTVR